MATTTNYGWTTPDDTALVKDGASAIRTLGTAIDTTVFNNASAGIAKTIVDAKGDIIAATAADTVARLAVGANDTVLTADSTAATGLKWATAGGSLDLDTIASGSMPAASSLNITGLTQDRFQLQLNDPQWATGASDLILRFNSYSTNGYSFVCFNVNASTFGRDFYSNTTEFPLSLSEPRNTGNSAWVIDIENGKASGFHTVSATAVYIDDSTGASIGFTLRGSFKNATPITSIQIINANSYNFSGGTYSLIGA